MGITDITKKQELIIVCILAAIGILAISWVILDWNSNELDIEQYSEYQKVSITNDKIDKLSDIVNKTNNTTNRISEKDKTVWEIEKNIITTNSTISKINNLKDKYSMILGIIIGYILGVVISLPFIRDYINKKLKDEGY